MIDLTVSLIYNKYVREIFTYNKKDISDFGQSDTFQKIVFLLEASGIHKRDVSDAFKLFN